MGRLLCALLILAILAVGVDIGARLVVEERTERTLEHRDYLGADSLEIHRGVLRLSYSVDEVELGLPSIVRS